MKCTFQSKKTLQPASCTILVSHNGRVYLKKSVTVVVVVICLVVNEPQVIKLKLYSILFTHLHLSTMKSNYRTLPFLASLVLLLFTLPSDVLSVRRFGEEEGGFICHCDLDIQCDTISGVCPGRVCSKGWNGATCQARNMAYKKRVMHRGMDSPTRVVDGSTGTAPGDCATTGRTVFPFIKVMLSSPTNISLIRFLIVEQFTSTLNISVTVGRELCGFAHIQPPVPRKSWQSVACNKKAGDVKLTVVNKEFKTLQLCEVQIFGITHIHNLPKAVESFKGTVLPAAEPGTVRLSWRRPLRTGGLAINSYRINYYLAENHQGRGMLLKVSGDELNKSGLEQMKILRSLEEGSTYILAVAAETDPIEGGGLGPWTSTTLTIPVGRRISRPVTYSTTTTTEATPPITTSTHTIVVVTTQPPRVSNKVTTSQASPTSTNEKNDADTKPDNNVSISQVLAEEEMKMELNKEKEADQYLLIKIIVPVVCLVCLGVLILVVVLWRTGKLKRLGRRQDTTPIVGFSNGTGETTLEPATPYARME